MCNRLHTYKNIPRNPQQCTSNIDNEVQSVVLVIAKNAQNNYYTVAEICQHRDPHISKKVKDLTFEKG